jgi:transcriptional regulator GlxA family with amidase domain
VPGERVAGRRATRLNAIKADITARIGDERLSVTDVASRHRVTARYVQMLFEADGTTFSAYLLEQRLAHAYRLLTDARLFDRAISTIAYDSGFANLSYFNRSFRCRFGETPSGVRDRVRRQG